jgi:hypothetical protein
MGAICFLPRHFVGKRKKAFAGGTSEFYHLSPPPPDGGKEKRKTKMGKASLAATMANIGTASRAATRTAQGNPPSLRTARRGRTANTSFNFPASAFCLLPSAFLIIPRIIATATKNAEPPPFGGEQLSR